MGLALFVAQAAAAAVAAVLVLGAAVWLSWRGERRAALVLLFAGGAGGALVLFSPRYMSWGMQLVGDLPSVVMSLLSPWLFGAAAVMAVAHAALSTARRRYAAAAAPLVVVAVAGVLFALHARHYPDPHREFARNAGAFAQAAALAERGQLAPREEFARGDAAFVALPWRYCRLSKAWCRVLRYERDGAVHVLFVEYVGMFGELAGYLHRPDGREPLPPAEYLYGSSFSAVERLADRWFWVAAG
jgi:hypothetical protein